jgi:hypothetical protein
VLIEDPVLGEKYYFDSKVIFLRPAKRDEL